MSEEKKNAATEEVKEARQLTEEELAQVNGGVATHACAVVGGVHLTVAGGARPEMLEK